MRRLLLCSVVTLYFACSHASPVESADSKEEKQASANVGLTLPPGFPSFLNNFLTSNSAVSGVISNLIPGFTKQFSLENSDGTGTSLSSSLTSDVAQDFADQTITVSLADGLGSLKLPSLLLLPFLALAPLVGPLLPLLIPALIIAALIFFFPGSLGFLGRRSDVLGGVFGDRDRENFNYDYGEGNANQAAGGGGGGAGGAYNAYDYNGAQAGGQGYYPDYQSERRSAARSVNWADFVSRAIEKVEGFLNKDHQQ